MYLQRMQASVTTYVMVIGYPPELYRPSVLSGGEIDIVGGKLLPENAVARDPARVNGT
jgi:hypothetical protein